MLLVHEYHRTCHAMILPTRRLWILLALGLVMTILGAFLKGAELLVVPYDIILIIVAVVTGLMARRYQGITVRRICDPILSVRVVQDVLLEVSCEGFDALPVTIRDEPPLGCLATNSEFSFVLAEGRPRTVKYQITPFERGSVSFPGTWIRFEAPLGLVMIQRELENGEPAHVYPNVKAIRDYELLKQKGHLSLLGVRKSRMRGLGTEFESLRDYNEDDYRRIDWKASARRGKLVVRNYEQEKNQSVIVCVDVGRHMMGEVQGVRKLDYALDASLMLMHAAERNGDQVGLLVFNDTIKRYVAPQKGRAHVAALIETIHAVQAEPVQPHYIAAFAYLATRWKKRSLVVVFTDAENADQASELAVALGPISRRHLLLVVRVADPRLKELLAAPLNAPGDLYSRAAALWYISDRRQADLKLRAVGFQSIEAEPQDLSAALVSAYIRVKELALI